MRIVVLDTETTPCLTMGCRVWGELPAPQAEAAEAMGAHRRAETDGKSDFLKPFMHRVVALGMVGITTDTGDVSLFAECSEDEARLLAAADRWLTGRPLLVTWNGLGFDLPVLGCRALHRGVAMPNLYGPPGLKSWLKYDNRYGEAHVDLMDRLAGNGRGNAMKLSEGAALCGLLCKRGDMDGSKVLAHWISGDCDVIKTYVRDDACDTARQALRWLVTTGHFTWAALQPLDEKLAAPQLEAAL